MEDILKLVIIVFSGTGIVLGLYGLFMPRVNLLLSRLFRSEVEEEMDEEHIERVLSRMREDFLGKGFEPFVSDDAAEPVAQRRSPIAVTPAPTAPGNDEDDEVDEEIAELLLMPLADADDEESEDETPPLISMLAAVSEPESEPAPDPLAAPASDPNDILSFFEEESDGSSLSTGLKDAIEDVPISDLLAEARQLREILAGKSRRAG